MINAFSLRSLYSCNRIILKAQNNWTRISRRLLWSYDHRPSGHPFIYETYYDVLERAAAHAPDRTAVISCQQKIEKTFSELRQDVRNAAAGLLSLGLEKGSSVAVLSPNNYEWIVMQYAAGYAGLVLVTLNPALTVQEIGYALNKSESKAVVLADSLKGQSFYSSLSTLIPELITSEKGNLSSKVVPSLKYVIAMFDECKPGTIPLEEIKLTGELKENQSKLENMVQRIQSDDCVNIQFTSGTTGLPKAACLSHFSLLNCANGFGRIFKLSGKTDRICVTVPLFHCFGNVLGSTAMGISQTTVVLPSATFEAEASLKAVSEEKCTVMYGSPTMFIDFLNNPEFSKYDYSSMRGGVMAASTCPLELLKAVHEKLNMKDLCVAYGTTENSPLITFADPSDPIEIRCSTVGRACEHIEVKVIDNEGKLVKRGQVGELCARGYQVFLGYKDDLEKTNEVFGEDRWYKTGDLATMDENGYIAIVGRIKDMIIRGGENIYPREVEEFLHTHPLITEAQVFGIPDQRLGEVVCAWVKAKDGEVLSEDDVKNFCVGKIAKFKIPLHISIVDSFPVTTSGKIPKFVMSDIMTKKLNNK